MGNTPQGAKKAVETTRKRYGDGFFKARAIVAARANKTPTFTDRELASKHGKKGAAKRWKLK